MLPHRLLGFRSRVIVVLAVGPFALSGAGAWAAGPRCAAGQTPGSCAVEVVSGLVDANTCDRATAPPQPPSDAQTAADRLESLIDYIPCPDTGRVSFNTRDDRGGSMSVLDPIPSSAGGYLGVYHTAFRRPGDPFLDFRISLARSTDLIHWTRLEVIDSTRASMPTLRTIVGSPGYLLAYEKALRGGNLVRLRYYPSLAALLAGRFSAQHDLPRMFSPYNNGTPTILRVQWHGALSRSVIELGFHYESAPKGRRGPDREAVGTLRGFRTFSAHTDPTTDSDLDHQGLGGSHGDWRQFDFGGSRWRLYEAQTAFDDFGTWRVILDDPSSGGMYPVNLTMGAQPVSSSFANPVARVEPAPSGPGQVLVITMFLFAAHGAGAAGELVYYQPI